MHKSATKCNETIGKWCKNKHGASKIIDTFETYQVALPLLVVKDLNEVQGLTATALFQHDARQGVPPHVADETSGER
jgi:hypothetical protein